IRTAFLARGIVGRLAGDGHVMDVALTQAGIADADEIGLAGKIRNGRRAKIAHGRPEAAHHLVDDGGSRALERNLALDPFGYELEIVLDVFLEIAVRRAARHGADRAHAAIGLVGTAL